jgi:transcriptional regulator with XRE-family HTH domain
MSQQTDLKSRTGEAASAFGQLIRRSRKALGLSQDELVLATGVGRRFLIELESGKASCQLGRSLVVARALGLSLNDILIVAETHAKSGVTDLPEPPTGMDE